ncbi:MAG: A alpha-helical domain with a conserved ER moti [Hyphomonas sp. BRH_c22]|uniref:alpha-E domain-containing protein n=1 Tax=Hyphomonas sp. BRH_c22 TaxID=1629710 RepID=UPI0005F1E1AB|nr:alpha-E domain-containing protein [Hyphomonas sp. BRH_c22]KJS39487.1 MAG: A alpha-helical domain with a conserved ER moti [Hyphomonas sp. BRH_c22]
MLGKTAGGLLWLSRYLERSENTARLVEAGFRMALTRAAAGEDEWASVLTTVGCLDAYYARHDTISPNAAVDFLLRDKTNPLSVYSVMRAARDNARATRTALTREVWEAVNDGWMQLKEMLKRPVSQAELPKVLTAVRQLSALVRGALQGTMLRNDIFSFSRIGSLIERADNTARILDVKYYVLLPTGASVGSSLDNVQWEMILRSASADKSFHWLYPGNANPKAIAEFLILDARMPRSLAYCYDELVGHLAALESEYGDRRPCHDLVASLEASLTGRSIDDIIDFGLHEFIREFLRANAALAAQIETDYRFYE